ncbi:hypothetical protein J5J10_12415 [Ciceribacter sp. L1K23]|uniref:hypothetical protein n=1 Tax=Ciceribacter sp. L1K23 TaxID=2820276 RepID=UPI001B811611|nr:hypothetical protein [Ciceribacter sp. L1K23]MBR0556482.1 hypothetical protein [Ciceribacter sp. L1K23]
MTLPLTLLWLVPALLMLGMTFAEGMAGGNRFDGSRLVGLLACLIWPVTLPALIVGSLVHARSHRGKPPVLTRHTDVI